MKTISCILIIALITLLGCEKDNGVINVNQEYLITITKNSAPFQEYKYSDSGMLWFKDFSGSKYKEWRFEYNSNNELSEITELNSNDDIVKFYSLSYTDGRITSVFDYKVNNGEQSLIEEKKLIYDDQFRLIKINAFMPETFEYDGVLLIKHGKVSSQRIWTTYQYAYDGHKNYLSTIGMPAIGIDYIIAQNIDSVVASWTEYIDNMGIDSLESSRHHEKLIYTSTFEYDKKGFPETEYRVYENHVDTLRYTREVLEH